MLKKQSILSLSLILGALGLFGCEAVKDTFGIPNRSPVISSFDYSPKSGITKNDIITFTVVANDPEGKPMQYIWTASKGTLTGNAGSTVSWRPAKQDNVFEPGLSSVSVIVSDGIMTTTASVNIYVSPEGRIITEPSAYPVSTPVPSPSAVVSEGPSSIPSPSSAPSLQPTPIPSVSPSLAPTSTPVPSVKPVKTVLEDGFENGFLDDKWKVSLNPGNSNNSPQDGVPVSEYGNKDYLTWKKVSSDSYQGNSAVAVTGPTDQVLINTSNHSEVRLASQIIDLRNTRLPRLTFFAKSEANPVSSVELKIYWSREGESIKPLNVSFMPEKNWNEFNIDLMNIPSIKDGPGQIIIGANISANSNVFKGPMLDNVSVFDEANK
mgnify:CR=1 FL=1